jgi:cobalt-zinc-cadmium efflux system outer membrane protein
MAPRLVTCTVLAWCVAMGVGRAQPSKAGAATPAAPDSATGLSLAEAIARAREQEPLLRAAQADVEAARGRRVQSGLRPNPTSMIESRREPGGTDRLLAIAVEWPLDLFRRGGRVATADHEVDASRWALADRERTLVADVRLAYGRAAAAIREAGVAAELAATAGRELALIQARVEAGAAPRLDADLLEVELRRLEAASHLAAGRAERGLLALKPLLGLAPQEPLSLRDGLDAIVTAGAAARAAGTSGPPLAERPDVRAGAAQVALAEARIAQARREGRLDMSLTAGYMRMDAGFPQLGLSPAGIPERVRAQFHYVSFGAAVRLPILDRNQGQIAAATADRAGAAARQQAIELAAASERAAAIARDARARQALLAFGDATRSLARRNLEALRQTFELGRASMTDVLAEQRRYLDFQAAYTATLLEAWEAQVDVERSSGALR